LSEADLWVHAAARIDFQPGDGGSLALYEANALLTDHLAAGVSVSGPSGRFVYLSTISVHGRGQAVSVDTEPHPDSDYGLSKLLGEHCCAARLGDRCFILRLAGIWGREDNPKLFVNRCLARAIAGLPLRLSDAGLAQRNYLWVGDIPRL